MSETPVIIKPGDEVVLVLNDTTYLNFGKLTGLSVKTVTPPGIQERPPKNAEEGNLSLRGHRFFEQELGTITSVVEFTFEWSIEYAPAADNTPDCSSD